MKTLLASMAVLLVIALLAWALGEQASATRQIAAAATVSAAGQTAGSVTSTVLAVLLALVLLVAVGAVLYLWLRMKALERQLPGPAPRTGRWAPGPHARWEPAEPEGRAVAADPLAQLVQLEVLRTLRELRGTRQQPALTVEDNNEEPPASIDASNLWPW